MGKKITKKFPLFLGKNFKRICNKKNFLLLKFFPKALSRADRYLILFFFFVIAVASFFVWRNQWLKNTHEEPAFGGTYYEGIVGKPKDLDKHLARLAGAGLTHLESNGEIKGDLAESWQIIDDGKTYQFKLRPGFISQDLANQIATKNIWPNIKVATPSEDTIVFNFDQPFSPFLYTSTEPVFSYGPYKIIKEEKNAITLLAQDIYWQGKPHIEKIILKLYPDKDALIKAAKVGDVMGYLKEKDDWQPTDFHLYEMSLPREMNLFFNLSKPDLQNVDRRRNLRDNEPLDQELNLTLVTSENPNNLKMAEDVKAKWKDLKVNLEIKKYDNITLQKDIIPKREYDVLLYGLDYGADPDPYPFWHSSQIKADGMNLANFSYKKADKLMEEARQTFDFNVRGQKYDELKKILDQEVPFITLKKETCFYILSDKIKGIEKIYGFAESDRFLNVSSWYIKSKRVKN